MFREVYSKDWADMRVALVHDYLNEYGGAERVLKALTEIWPQAPIYTAFAVPGSTAMREFSGKKMVTSWFQRVPGYSKLYSPLRFLIPWIWGSWDFSDYDLIVTSASWYVTKGLGKKFGVKEICYCHTPPRWLYGYPTSVNWQRFRVVRAYALLTGHFLRMYDFGQAQKVGVFVANSREVAGRIRKFYRREAEVIYPPVDLPRWQTLRAGKEDYYLMVTRLVGGKGIELAVGAAKKYGLRLKIAGEAAGWAKVNVTGIEYLGRVSEDEKWKLMAQAKAFLALAREEDFGITPAEAMGCGTPVIAFRGGGYTESVVDGKTGVLFDDYSTEGLMKAIYRFNKLKWKREILRKKAEEFSKENFKKRMLQLVRKYAGTAGN